MVGGGATNLPEILG